MRVRLAGAELEALRQEGDPPADRLVAGLAQGGEVEAVNRLLGRLFANRQAVPADLPEPVADWLRETGRLPEGADPERLERAANLFLEHGMVIALILSTASLVECYAAVKGVKVLAFTYRLGQNAYRRVAETAQWLLFVMAPGGLTTPQGEGIRAVQKVRLLHGTIRYLIEQTGRWDGAAWGVPICQEDLAFTLMTFSYIVLRNLRRLGFPVTAQQAEDYLYAWNVIGAMLGIRPDLLPANMAEAQAFVELFRRRHHGPSTEGVAMTGALLEMHRDLMPGELFDGEMPALVRLLVGDQVADWMAVPYTSWHGLVARYHRAVGARLGEAERRLGPVQHLVGALGLALMKRRAFALSGYRRAGFAIPTRLRDAWGVAEGL
jgi:hypothetical protein